MTAPKNMLALVSVSAVMATLLVFSASMTWAQTVPQLGIPPYSSVTGGPDQVNLSNLSIHYTIPVFSRAGRGAPFSFVMNEDNVTWSQVYNVNLNQNQWTPFFPLTGGGLNGIGAVFYTKVPKTCTDSSGDQVNYNLYTFSSFQDSSGTTHAFGALGLQLTDLTDNTGTCYSQYNKYPRNQASANASDGSAINIAVNLSPAVAATVTTPHGDIIHAPLITYTGGAWVATGSPYTWVDSNGNEITETLRTGSIGVATVTDNLGSIAITGSGTYPSPITYSYTAPSGAAAAYKQTFKAYTVQTAFNCPSVAEYPATQWYLLDKLYLPNTAYFYQFNYETSVGSSVTGRLKSVTLPTGGTISYQYTGGDTNTGIICQDGSVAGLNRTTPDGTWQYGRSNIVDAAPNLVLSSTTTITDPQTNQTVVNFNGNDIFGGNWETQRQVYTGTAGGTPLETVITCYNGNTSNCATATGFGPPFNEIDVYRSLNGGSQARVDTKITTATGQVYEKDEYDFGSSTLSRKTAISYATLGNGIVDRPSLVTVTDGSGSLLSQTGYTYDEDQGSLQGSGAPQLVPVNCAPGITMCRGNVTTLKQYSTSSAYLTKTFNHYDTGQVYQTNDVNGATTMNTYGQCSHSLLSNVLVVPLNLSTSYQWSCTGGVNTQITDSNSQSTYANYTTDAYFWRPESTKDQSLNVTTLTYTGLTRVESVLPVTAGSSNVDITKTLDTLGRPSLTQTKQAPNSSTFDTVQQTYDSDGRPYHTTMPCAAGLGSGCTTPQTTTLYDGMGRVVTFKDGSGATVTTTSYSQNDVYADVAAPTGENDKRRQMQYDGLGRLTSVCEIVSTPGDPYSGPCPQTNGQTGYYTQYSYNGTTLTVTQNSQKGPTQTRTYTYDALGRLTLESNPETGTTQYFYDTAPSSPGVSCPSPSTSNGDLVKKYDAQGNTICYQYDALHRLTAVFYPGGPDSGRSAQRHFVYDSTLVSTYSLSNTLGRLSEAYTGPSTGKITDLGFSYTPRGEVSDVYESTPHSGGWYHVQGTYFPHGLLNTLNTFISSMPTIYFGGNNCGSCLDGEGRLLQVNASTGQNPVGSVTYATSGTTQPIGSLTKVTYGSGDFDNFSYDTNTGRMTQYQFSVGATPQTDTGGLTWNANGTLKTLAITDQVNPSNSHTCSFTYDDLSRISQDSCTPTVWGQSFTYDPFGNVDKTGSSAFTPTYTSSPSTNQYLSVPACTGGPSYNLNGDATNDCLHQYTWNADNRPTSIDTTNTYTYDALGRLAELVYTGGNTEYLYSPTGQELALMNGQTLQKAMFHLPGGGTAIYKNASPPLNHYRHGDWLGSARLSTTPNQTCYYDVSYAPFGETYDPLVCSGGNTSVAFAGQGKDTTTDLYPFLFREYNSIQSRWVWPDPSGLGAVSMENPQSWNRYGYVANGPLNTVDPSGLHQINDYIVNPGDWGALDPGAAFIQGAIQDFLVQAGLNSNVKQGLRNYQAQVDDAFNGTTFTQTPGYFTSTHYTIPGATVSFLGVDTTFSGSLIGYDWGSWAIPALSGSVDASSDPTLDNRANSLAQAINKTGVQALNPSAQDVKGWAKAYFCGSSPANNIRNWTIEGGVKGAAVGAIAGGVTGTILGTPVGGFFGAIYGGLLDGTASAGGGVFAGSAASVVCSALGAY